MKNWLRDLTAEVCERLDQDLEENERRATLLTVSFHYYQNQVETSQSRSCPLNSYKPEKVAASCFNVITKSVQHPISFIGLSAGKFIAAKGSDFFRNFFKTNTNKHDNETNSSESTDVKKELNTNVEHKNDHEVKSVLNSKKNNCTTEESTVRKDENDFRQDKNECKTIENPDIEHENLLNNYKRTSRDSFDRALNSDHFKQSFFMNILKRNHESPGNGKNDSQVNKEKHDEIPDGNINDLNVSDSEENHLNDSENLEQIPSCDSFISIENSSKTEHQKIQEKMEAGSKYSNSQILNSNWSAAKMDNMEPFVNNNGNVSVKLREIFPDLSDIDPGVISLLPQELQKEASELLKNTTKTNKKAEILAKHIKMKKSNNNNKKCQEPRSSKSENTIQNFLIKPSTSSETDDSFKKCDKCHQLVQVEKLIEHNDYHIAHELQREMNKIDNNSTLIQDNNNCMKRKYNFDSNGENSKKRGTKTQKNNTKSKSIASYFS